MLFKILDNLRSKPKHIREQYALGIAVASTLLIGGVWTLSLPARFAGENQVAALASTTNAAPFSNFFSQLKHQFSGVKKTIDELPKGTSTPTSIASSTEAALDLKLSEENKDKIKASSTETKIEFGTSASTSARSESGDKPVLVGTTSTAVKPAR